MTQRPPLQAGRLFAYTLGLYRRYPLLTAGASLSTSVLLAITGLLFVLLTPWSFAQALGSDAESSPETAAAWGSCVILSVLLPLAWFPYMSHLVAGSLSEAKHAPPSLARLFGRSLYHLPHALAALSMGFAISFVGLAMLLVPGLLAIAWSAYAAPVAVIDQPRPIRRAWSISRHLAGLGGLQAGSLVLVILCFVGLSHQLAFMALGQLIGPLFALSLTAPLFMNLTQILLSVIYFRLREIAA